MPPRGHNYSKKTRCLQTRKQPASINEDVVAEMLASSGSKFAITKQTRQSNRLKQRNPSPVKLQQPTRMTQTLTLLGRETVPTQGDGNCGPAAVVSTHCPPLGISQQQLRARLASFLRSVESHVLFRGWTEHFDPVASQIVHEKEALHVGKRGNWFRTFHLAATAVMLKRDIAVIYEDKDIVEVLSRKDGISASMTGEQFLVFQQDQERCSAADCIIIGHTGFQNSRHFHATAVAQPI
jgi:hypothetical protein